MSNEYIRKQDAVEATWEQPLYTDPLYVLTEVRSRIKALPPADVVQVVRCKNCRYRVDSDMCCHPDGML